MPGTGLHLILELCPSKGPIYKKGGQKQSIQRLIPRQQQGNQGRQENRKNLCNEQAGESPGRFEIWKRIGAAQPSLKIQEGETDSVQVAESMQLEVHSLKWKSPYVPSLP